MFYKRFYFRAPKIASIVGEMVRSPQMMKRRLREGVEFFQFMRDRNKGRLSARRVIVSADDFGLSEGVKRGRWNAPHRDGILSTTSLMVGRPQRPRTRWPERGACPICAWACTSW